MRIFNLFYHASFAQEFMATKIKSLVRDNSNYLPIGNGHLLLWDEDDGLIYKNLSTNKTMDVNLPSSLFSLLDDLVSMDELFKGAN